MNKCYFCTQLIPNGKRKTDGYLNNPYTKELYCKEAIEKMINFYRGRG